MTKPMLELIAEYGDECFASGHDYTGEAGDASEIRAGLMLHDISQRLESERSMVLTAMRRACIALAHAAEKDPTYDTEYKLLSDAIAAMALEGK